MSIEVVVLIFIFLFILAMAFTVVIAEEQKTEWDTYAVCSCGFTRRAPFGDVDHTHLTVCPGCGAPKKHLEVWTLRWVPTPKLFKPSTWSTGYWETRDYEE